MARTTTPQLIMMRASQRRAPTRTSRRLLGISNTQYPTKKIPAANPYTAGVKPKSSFICRAAKLMFVRSIKLTKSSSIAIGISRRNTLRSALAATSVLMCLYSAVQGRARRLRAARSSQGESELSDKNTQPLSRAAAQGLGERTSASAPICGGLLRLRVGQQRHLLGCGASGIDVTSCGGASGHCILCRDRRDDLPHLVQAQMPPTLIAQCLRPQEIQARHQHIHDLGENPIAAAAENSGEQQVRRR